jgi:hypothetical protein
MKVMSSTKRKGKQPSNNPLPTSLLSTLEASDKKAAKLRQSQKSSSLVQSHAAKSQLDVQTHLLESRILLQRALTGGSITNTIKDKGTKKNLDVLLKRLLLARKKMNSNPRNHEDDYDDEVQNYTKVTGDTLQSEYDSLRPYWKNVLNQHHSHLNQHHSSNRKTKFQVVDQSFWSQVEATYQHNSILEQSSNLDDIETHMEFDDSKLYQSQLQEYITLSTEKGPSHAVLAAKERLKRASKTVTKKNVDRKASKGRKIRYVVHDKLKNFTFPVQREGRDVVMSENVLFKSMFGGTRKGLK